MSWSSDFDGRCLLLVLIQRYLSALESHPPLIKRHDYDSDLFDAIDQFSASGIDTPSNTPLTGLRGFVDLVTTIGHVLERLHGGGQIPSSGLAAHHPQMSSVELVLTLEKDMEDLRERLGTQTFGSLDDILNDGTKRTAKAGSLLRQIHYHWYASVTHTLADRRLTHRSRIALRAPFLRHDLLRHSSLAICARSAMTILHIHRLVGDLPFSRHGFSHTRNPLIATGDKCRLAQPTVDATPPYHHVHLPRFYSSLGWRDTACRCPSGRAEHLRSATYTGHQVEVCRAGRGDRAAIGG